MNLPKGRSYIPTQEELDQEERDRLRTYLIDEVMGNRWERQEREREEAEKENEEDV